MVALPLCPSPSQSSVSEYWLGFHVVRSGVDTGGHRYCSRLFGAVEIRGIHESGMGPYLPRVRRKCPPLMGLYPLGRRCRARTNRRLANRIGVSRRAGWCRPEEVRFASPVDGSVRDVERPLDRGWDPISSRGGAGSTYEPWPIKKFAGGVGISTPSREVSTRMTSRFVPGLSEL